MSLVVLVASLSALAPAACAGGDEARTEVEQGLVASALGLERLARGDLAGATACLEEASRALPRSSVVARDLAIAYAAAGRTRDALAEIDRAIALGDPGTEAAEVRALLLADLGRTREAREALEHADGWEAELLAASLGDGRAARRASELVAEDTARGALASLVLAGRAGEQGDLTAAELLVDRAKERADAAGVPALANAARRLESGLDRSPRFGARLRASIDHATNPSLRSAVEDVRSSGLRVALTGEGAVAVPLGMALLQGSLRLDQHLFLTDRSALRDLDLQGLSLAASLTAPISREPSAAVVGVAARFSDTFGDRLRVHYATAIEAGPNLLLTLSSALRLELGLYGVATDFISNSPADARVSSLNRDFIGQRAIVGLAFSGGWLDARVETMFLRNDALGDAFDAVGGVFGGRARAYPGAGIVLSLGTSVAIREFGPVGEEAIIGRASTRTEVRTLVELGAEIPIASNLDVFVGDVWMRTSARQPHAYTENVLSVGVERRW